MAQRTYYESSPDNDGGLNALRSKSWKDGAVNGTTRVKNDEQ